MAEAISESLGNIHLNRDDQGEKVACESTEQSNKEDDASKVVSTQTEAESSSSLSSSTAQPMLICDAWYGFPTQKRPRRERIYAVSRQLTNFLDWQSSSTKSSGFKDSNQCQVALLGKEGDVEAVHSRMDELAGQSQSTKICNDTMTYHSNVSIHEYLEKQKSMYNPESIDEVVYLSPDASYTLPATAPPPRIVIVGMLIDRRITTDRSRVRAEETLELKAAKLPLDELNVKELTSQEPLNVDTVQELMQRWWWNYDKVKQQMQKTSENGGNDKVERDMYRKCFLQAAAWSMKTQRERHPNRTVHGTN